VAESAVEKNPCLTCGACCAGFRVSFYWGEGDDAPGGFVPVQFTNQMNLMSRCMKGTDSSTPRCECLSGEVGTGVACTIYENRPTPCREFKFHGEGGEENLRCNKIRAKHGMIALTVS
jgi:uncharacterized protein